jgi:hypothetical protein
MARWRKLKTPPTQGSLPRRSARPTPKGLMAVIYAG